MPRLPADIPRNPSHVYDGHGWTSWGNFFGTGTRHLGRRPWRPCAEASAYVIKLGIKSGQQFDDWCAGRLPGLPARPADIPADPSLAYRGCGWAGSAAFFGTKNDQVKLNKRHLRPFEQARALVRTIGARSAEEYRAWCAGIVKGAPPRPADIPTNPQISYRGRGWVSWPDFLGTAKIEPKSMISAVLDILLR
jgi:hypothetical protein